MPITPGATVGVYEISGPLGAGGMGEVYRARDSRLGRDVALKILPAELAADPDRLARFTREARLASQLNHPNIVVLHDVGVADGVNYLSMELVDGRTLNAWIESAKPPLSKRIAIAAQTAEGLAHAHRAGIVHRDLKPANVMVTADGHAKILDFGIARRLLTGDASFTTHTVSVEETAQGVLIGTVPYMSPEQARGDAVDYRSDQFALGTMIYEMVTGRHPFAKSSPLHTLAAIIDEDVPALSSTHPALPLPLAWAVSRCLSKDPVDRYEATADLARDLRAVASHLSGSMVAPASRAARKWPGRQIAAVAVIALLGAAGGWLAAVPPATDGADVPTFRQLTFRRGLLQSARFTGDGANIVYGGAWDGQAFEMSVLRSESADSQKLDFPSAGLFAVSRGGALAIARDCRWVPAGQNCLGTLAVAPLGAGGARSVAEGVAYADWSPEGEQLAFVRAGTPMQLEFPAGRVVYSAGAISHPRVSRDGKLIAFFAGKASLQSVELRVLDTASGESRALLSAVRFPSGLAWSADGTEVWFTNSSESRDYDLLATDLDGRQRTVFRQAQDFRLFDVAPDGRVLLGQMRSSVNQFVSTAGSPPRAYSWNDSTVTDALSADGRTIVFSERGRSNRLFSYSLFVREIDGSAPVFLGEGRGMAISPDKKWVLANRSYDDRPTAVVLYPTGVGTPQTFAVEPGEVGSFLPDSTQLVLGGRAPEAGTYLINLINRSVSRVAHVRGMMVSQLAPDGDRFFARQPDGSVQMERLSGPTNAPASLQLGPAEIVRQWTPDGRAVYVVNLDNPLAKRVDRLDLSTMKRSEVAVVRPHDPTGVMRGFNLIHLTPDARTMVFSESQAFGELILASGIR